MANSKIRGITIEIGGDTTKLDKALGSVDKKVKGTQVELREVNKLLKIDPKIILARTLTTLHWQCPQLSSRLDRLGKN